MKKLGLIFTILILVNYCSAQHFEFDYDVSGNRTNRNYLVPRLANPALADIEKKHGISVYPNPAPEKINVSISSLEVGETADIYLSDEQGKILLSKKQNSTLAEVDLSNLKAGIYYLRVFIKSENITYKIVKL